MPELRVLDMSNCFLLNEVPEELGKLINLQYLNLSGTRITKLPVVRTKLRCLLLSPREIDTVSKEIISNHQELQLFSRSPECLLYYAFRDETILLDKLENLQCLSDLRITIQEAESVRKVSESHKLQPCLRKLTLWGCPYLTSLTVIAPFSGPSMMKNVQSLQLVSSCDMERVKIIPRSDFASHDLFHSLREVVIKRCDCLQDVTWLIYAPGLKTLSLVEWCYMEQVIGDNVGFSVAEIVMMSKAKEEGIFSSLSILRLHELENLRSIC